MFLNQPGIYQIRNVINGKVYIGQAINVRRRLTNHKTYLRKIEYPPLENRHLWNSWKKYGEENFVFEVVEYCSLSDLDRKEEYWIKGTPINLRFNKRETFRSNKGIKIGSPSEETRLKISMALTGRKMSKEYRDQVSARMRGRKLPQEWVDKLRESQSKRINAAVEVLSRRVIQLDKDTDLALAEYKSISAAARSVNVNGSNINQVCLGHRKSAGGYKWKYA